MKKILISCTLLCVCIVLGFSQKSQISLSPEYKLAKNKVLMGHLHSNNSGHYMYFREYKGMLAGRRSKLILEKYDKKFKNVFSKEFATDKKNVYGSDIKYFKNKFAWLMYEKNSKNDFLEYFLAPINMKGKSSKPKSIAKFKYESRSDIPDISWEMSEDTSSVLFIAANDDDKKKENYEVFVSVIDEDFNKVWSKKIKLPYSQKRVQASSFELTKDGKVYFVAKIYEDNKTKESKTKKRKGKKNKKAPAYDIVIYSIDQTMDKPAKYKLNLKDAFVKGVKINVDDANDVACVGFFGDSRKGPTQGVFYLKLSKEDGSTIFANKRRFTPKELANFGDRNTSKDKKSKDSGLDKTFSFNKIVSLENGEIFVTAEENYSYTVTSTDSKGNVTTRIVYVSNSIIVINISADGKVKNVGIIPKKQKMSARTFQSYALLRTDDEVYFVYNDDKDNIRKNITDPDKIRRISSAKDCVAVLTKLSSKGKMDRKQLFTKKEAKTLLMPTRSSQISKDELFFFNSRPQLIGKSKFRFGILKL